MTQAKKNKEKILKNISPDWVDFQSIHKGGITQQYFINLKTGEKIDSTPLLLEHWNCGGKCDYCQLNEAIKEAKKQHLINNPSEWSVGILGNFRKSDEQILHTYKSIEDYWFSGSSSNPNWEVERKANVFGVSDHKEDLKLKKLFSEEIKQNPQDWHIERENKLTIVKHKSGRKHYKEGFFDVICKEVWKEIEDALGWKQKDFSSKDKKPQNSTQKQKPPTPKSTYRNHVIILVILTFLLLLTIIGFIITKRNKRS